MAHDHFYGICENKCLVEIEHDNIPGVVPVEKGGTGATTAADALSNLGAVGKNLEGQAVSPTQGTTVTAEDGAEIFNDYRERTYNEDGTVAAGNVASGLRAHAEGMCTTASGLEAHAEGYRTIASSNQAHAEGHTTTASGNRAHAEGKDTTASGNHSHAEGWKTVAKGLEAHAEGSETTASGDYSHAEGKNTTAEGTYSHAEGCGTTATGNFSHAEGNEAIAKGSSAHAEGFQTEASGAYSHAGGRNTIANGYQLVHGKYNKSVAAATGYDDTSGSVFILGNGTGNSSRSNAFRVTMAGAVYGKAAYNSSGADYAEMWEIEGGNPNEDDWRGLFVTVNENNKIEIANPDDYILGIISATPSVLGDVQSEIWHKMYLKDVFGEHLTETVEVEETTDEFGDVTPAHTETRWILNPEYDSSKEYISRDERPEWAAVGLIGKLVVVDDGTCTPGQFCKVADGGIATASGNNEGYRVLERCDKNHVRIMFR